MRSPASVRDLSGHAAMPVDRILKPQSIAIVGASADPRSFGGFVLANLERFGYAGAIHLVSRSSSEINGRACVKTVGELPEGIDLAVLAIPEAGVLEAVRGLAARHTHAAVLFASGYAEAGEEGRARQDALAAVARDAGMLLLGPNCMGFTNFEAGVPVTFEPVQSYPCNGRPGIGVVAQSGAMAANLRDAVMGRGLPLTATVSTGNEASVGIEDVLAYYIADPQTRVIAVYAEQVRRPRLFLQLARQARRRQAHRDADAGQERKGARGGAVSHRCAGRRSCHRLGGTGARGGGTGEFPG